MKTTKHAKITEQLNRLTYQMTDMCDAITSLKKKIQLIEENEPLIFRSVGKKDLVPDFYVPLLIAGSIKLYVYKYKSHDVLCSRETQTTSLLYDETKDEWENELKAPNFFPYIGLREYNLGIIKEFLSKQYPRLKYKENINRAYQTGKFFIDIYYTNDEGDLQRSIEVVLDVDKTSSDYVKAILEELYEVEPDIEWMFRLLGGRGDSRDLLGELVIGGEK